VSARSAPGCHVRHGRHMYFSLKYGRTNTAFMAAERLIVALSAALGTMQGNAFFFEQEASSTLEGQISTAAVSSLLSVPISVFLVLMFDWEPTMPQTNDAGDEDSEGGDDDDDQDSRQVILTRRARPWLRLMLPACSSPSLTLRSIRCSSGGLFYW
jgi:hypothetical protein